MKEGMYVKLVDEPKYTNNLFGPISEIAGKKLRVMDVSTVGDGDCLCIFTGQKGQNLVDVDHRDIIKE